MRNLVFNNSRMDKLPTEWTFDEYLFSNMKPSTAKHPSNKTENNGYNAKNS